jgi:hypothetical protein
MNVSNCAQQSVGRRLQAFGGELRRRTIFSFICRSGIALTAMASCAVAKATFVTIDAAKYGASSAAGGPNQPNVQPGVVLNDNYAPKDQLTLGAGTYLITNAATTGYYSSWNFEGYPTSPNWVELFDRRRRD